MPPARQEESREWLLLPEPLTDEVLRRRRLRRRNALIAIVGVWIAAAALWALSPKGAAMVIWTLVLLALVPGIWVGYRAQTPHARRQYARWWRVCWAGCGLVALGFVPLSCVSDISHDSDAIPFAVAVFLALVQGPGRLAILILSLILFGTWLGRSWYLDSAALVGVDLSNRSLDGLELPRKVLSEANLSGSSLNGAHLGMATLRQANLSGASLQRANLYQAYLFGADLSNAQLQHADLRLARLAEANLTGADLCGANLWGARLNRAQLDGVLYNDETQWPENFDPEEHGAIRVDSDIASEDPNPA